MDAEIQRVDASVLSSPAPEEPPPAKLSPAVPQAQTPLSLPLPHLLVEIVKESSRPLSAKDLTEEVRNRQFRTKSKNLRRLVETRVQELLSKGIFQRAEDKSGLILAESQGGAKALAAKPATRKQPSKKSEAVPPAAPPAKLVNQKKTSLREVLFGLLAKSKRPLLARELADQALAEGYPTKSKDFTTVVWVMLGKMENVENIQNQGYRLKKR